MGNVFPSHMPGAEIGVFTHLRTQFIITQQCNNGVGKSPRVFEVDQYADLARNILFCLSKGCGYDWTTAAKSIR